MLQTCSNRLNYLCTAIPPLLLAFPEKEFTFKPASNAWSKKEILGHLLDSAANNHQRFVRAQLEDVPFITYDADTWNACSHYQNMDSEHLIHFWKYYNLHLAILIKNIPEQNLKRLCKTGDQSTVNLAFLIEDYVSHLEHHLKQLVNYR